MKLDYTHGLDKIYTRQEIEKAKRSPSFGREYDLKYLGLIGNAFHTRDIDAAITEAYNPFDHHSISTFYGRSIGLDPGYGDSPFAIVITQFRDGYVEVLFAEEYDRPLQNEIIERVIRLNNKHHIGRILVDALAGGGIPSSGPPGRRTSGISLSGSPEIGATASACSGRSVSSHVNGRRLRRANSTICRVASDECGPTILTPTPSRA